MAFFFWRHRHHPFGGGDGGGGVVCVICAQAARIALGKFEVLMRADCLAADLPLLAPYLAREVSPADMADMAR